VHKKLINGNRFVRFECGPSFDKTICKNIPVSGKIARYSVNISVRKHISPIIVVWGIGSNTLFSNKYLSGEKD